MKLGNNAITVLEKRYITRDESGVPIETVEGLFRRVAKAVASADSLYEPGIDLKPVEDKFFEMMTNLEFLPNSPTLMNAGKELGQLSACFVLPVGDSMEEIFEAVKQAALIHKSGGGTGFSFSRLRSQGSSVKSTGGVASGPVSFMKVFNAATEAVKQGGTRRGANMGILRADHPDILDFIDCKSNNSDITNFNISIGMTEDFMRAAERGDEYNLVDPATKKVTGTLNAADVFAKIVNAAWSNGEPGIIFLDRLNRDNTVPSLGEIESTNPCGEQPLLPYESCNLGSVNLAQMLKQNNSGGLEIDYDRLGATVSDAVHFLDNVIDVNRYPLEIIEKTTKLTRKIGLGVMGFADLLLLLGIPYNSNDGVELGGKIMQFINDTGHAASIELAKKRGAFPMFGESVFSGGEPFRNATVTTIAPTGTLSIIAGCSSGIEPVFAFAFVRDIMDNAEMVETSPILHKTLKDRELYTDALAKRIIEEGTLARIDEIPVDIRRVFVCSHDISPEYHIRMQAAFQRHTDNAVSKTVNFPNSATPHDVENIYMLAYKLGCKGTTIYRDGSREGQTLSIGGAGKKTSGTPEEARAIIAPRDRSESMLGVTKRVAIGCGNLYVTVNYDESGICEVFTSTGKAGGCPSQSEATARLASIALRSGVDIKYVIRQMSGIRCPSTVSRSGMKCASCPDAIARVIKEVDANLKTGRLASAVTSVTASATPNPVVDKPDYPVCPECSESLEHEGGCVSCRNCGYSKCG